jgi:hypothetical protein
LRIAAIIVFDIAAFAFCMIASGQGQGQGFRFQDALARDGQRGTARIVAQSQFHGAIPVRAQGAIFPSTLPWLEERARCHEAKRSSGRKKQENTQQVDNGHFSHVISGADGIIIWAHDIHFT